MPNTIILKGELGDHYEEARASGTITPGMLCEIDSDAKIKAHATAGGYAEKIVAIEDALSGGSSNNRTIDTDYVANDLVRYKVLSPGDEAYMILKDGEDADENEKLTSNGDGKLQVLAGSEIPLFQCREAVAASGADARIKVRAL